jgi:hypothetical protein
MSKNKIILKIQIQIDIIEYHIKLHHHDQLLPVDYALVTMHLKAAAQLNLNVSVEAALGWCQLRGHQPAGKKLVQST